MSLISRIYQTQPPTEEVFRANRSRIRHKSKLQRIARKTQRPSPSGAYAQYIQSDAWKSKRNEVFSRRGRKCQDCGSCERIEVHHLTYANLGAEKLHDLRVLCHHCHEKRHHK